MAGIISLFEIGALGSILIVAGIVVVTVVLGLFIMRRIQYDHLYFIDITDKKRIYTHDEMERSINNSIKVKNKFYLFEIYIKNYKDLALLNDHNSLIEASQRLVNRLESEMGEGVRLCNYDEGVILVYVRDNGEVNVNLLAKSIKEITSRKVVLTNKTNIAMEMSIAVAQYPMDGSSLDSLLATINTIIHDSKKKVRPVTVKTTTSVVYSEKISANMPKEAAEIEEIKTALTNNEFKLFYHPIVMTKTLDILGVECLVRWNHPTRGILPPSAFLPILERTGEINVLGNWIINEAARQMLVFRTKGLNYWMSINLSVKQLSNPDIIKDYTRVLQKNNLEASDFYLEIYDISSYSKIPVVRDTIDKLSQMGFKIAVDKFGRGTAALTDLEKVPLSLIKVDMAFLMHAKENILYSGIINALNQYVKENDIIMVADGVETVENIEWSVMYDLRYLQGFYFTKPVDAQTIIDEISTCPWKVKSVGMKGITLDTPTL
ncbi:MAG: EAL domain-containing protein [Clostridia bacterium]|nr:EAL domain-containing protein [Clostridia bacterium]